MAVTCIAAVGCIFDIAVDLKEYAWDPELVTRGKHALDVFTQAHFRAKMECLTPAYADMLRRLLQVAFSSFLSGLMHQDLPCTGSSADGSLGLQRGRRTRLLTMSCPPPRNDPRRTGP